MQLYSKRKLNLRYCARHAVLTDSMVRTMIWLLAASTLLQSVSSFAVKQYAATTSNQYIRKQPSTDNGEVVWELAPSSAYSPSSYYLEIYWYTFLVTGSMPRCQPDYVEVFVSKYEPFLPSFNIQCTVVLPLRNQCNSA